MNYLLFYRKENQIPPTYSSLNFFIFLSLQFSNINKFLLSFLRDWEAHKVETWYTHGQRVDLLCTLKTSSQNILVPLFFFFFLSLQLAKIKNLLLQIVSTYFWWLQLGVCELCSLSAIFGKVATALFILGKVTTAIFILGKVAASIFILGKSGNFNIHCRENGNFSIHIWESGTFGLRLPWLFYCKL